MATAEQLLHQAQYAFQCISFGESRENKRNASRAKSLCMKIIRKHPGSMEAGEAHAVLRRLGEEAYSSKLNIQHRHISQAEHHRPEVRTPVPQPKNPFVGVSGGQAETLDWSGLLSLLFMAPKYVLGLIAFAGFFLFGVLGPFLFIPLVAFVLFTGPFRQILKPQQRREMNAFIARANDYVEQQRRGNA